MDYVKEAFKRVKQDMNLLISEIDSLKSSFKEIEMELYSLKKLVINNNVKPLDFNPTQNQDFSTIPTSTSTDNSVLRPLKDQNLGISTGNQGVPTDKQTNRQTNRQIDINEDHDGNSIENAIKILNSLDSLKKEVRIKFKRLTEQEFLVFSTLYQLEEEKGFSDYKTLSIKLNLTESSIRDYIGRLIKKGIPVEKHKINNKNIQLTISKSLKKIATLSTILQLRDL